MTRSYKGPTDRTTQQLLNKLLILLKEPDLLLIFSSNQNTALSESLVLGENTVGHVIKTTYLIS